MNNKIKDNLRPLYELYDQYKELFKFYKSFKGMKNVDDIKERIEYLKKNPSVGQRTELECLMWIIGEFE